MYLTPDLVPHVLFNLTIHACLKAPRELGDFENKHITEGEEVVVK